MAVLKILAIISTLGAFAEPFNVIHVKASKLSGNVKLTTLQVLPTKAPTDAALMMDVLAGTSGGSKTSLLPSTMADLSAKMDSSGIEDVSSFIQMDREFLRTVSGEEEFDSFNDKEGSIQSLVDGEKTPNFDIIATGSDNADNTLAANFDSSTRPSINYFTSFDVITTQNFTNKLKLTKEHDIDNKINSTILSSDSKETQHNYTSNPDYTTVDRMPKVLSATLPVSEVMPTSAFDIINVETSTKFNQEINESESKFDITKEMTNYQTIDSRNSDFDSTTEHLNTLDLIFHENITQFPTQPITIEENFSVENIDNDRMPTISNNATSAMGNYSSSDPQFVSTSETPFAVTSYLVDNNSTSEFDIETSRHGDISLVTSFDTTTENLKSLDLNVDITTTQDSTVQTITNSDIDRMTKMLSKAASRREPKHFVGTTDDVFIETSSLVDNSIFDQDSEVISTSTLEFDITTLRNEVQSLVSNIDTAAGSSGFSTTQAFSMQSETTDKIDNDGRIEMLSTALPDVETMFISTEKLLESTENDITSSPFNIITELNFEDLSTLPKSDITTPNNFEDITTTTPRPITSEETINFGDKASKTTKTIDSAGLESEKNYTRVHIASESASISATENTTFESSTIKNQEVETETFSPFDNTTSGKISYQINGTTTEQVIDTSDIKWMVTNSQDSTVEPFRTEFDNIFDTASPIDIVSESIFDKKSEIMSTSTSEINETISEFDITTSRNKDTSYQNNDNRPITSDSLVSNLDTTTEQLFGSPEISVHVTTTQAFSMQPVTSSKAFDSEESTENDIFTTPSGFDIVTESNFDIKFEGLSKSDITTPNNFEDITTTTPRPITSEEAINFDDKAFNDIRIPKTIDSAVLESEKNYTRDQSSEIPSSVDLLTESSFYIKSEGIPTSTIGSIFSESSIIKNREVGTETLSPFDITTTGIINGTTTEQVVDTSDIKSMVTNSQDSTVEPFGTEFDNTFDTVSSIDIVSESIFDKTSEIKSTSTSEINETTSEFDITTSRNKDTSYQNNDNRYISSDSFVSDLDTITEQLFGSPETTQAFSMQPVTSSKAFDSEESTENDIFTTSSGFDIVIESNIDIKLEGLSKSDITTPNTFEDTTTITTVPYTTKMTINFNDKASNDSAVLESEKNFTRDPASLVDLTESSYHTKSEDVSTSTIDVTTESFTVKNQEVKTETLSPFDITTKISYQMNVTTTKAVVDTSNINWVVTNSQDSTEFDNTFDNSISKISSTTIPKTEPVVETIESGPVDIVSESNFVIKSEDTSAPLIETTSEMSTTPPLLDITTKLFKDVTSSEMSTNMVFGTTQEVVAENTETAILKTSLPTIKTTIWESSSVSKNSIDSTQSTNFIETTAFNDIVHRNDIIDNEINNVAAELDTRTPFSDNDINFVNEENIILSNSSSIYNETVDVDNVDKPSIVDDSIKITTVTENNMIDTKNTEGSTSGSGIDSGKLSTTINYVDLSESDIDINLMKQMMSISEEFYKRNFKMNEDTTTESIDEGSTANIEDSTTIMNLINMIDSATNGIDIKFQEDNSEKTSRDFDISISDHNVNFSIPRDAFLTFRGENIVNITWKAPNTNWNNSLQVDFDKSLQLNLVKDSKMFIYKAALKNKSNAVEPNVIQLSDDLTISISNLDFLKRLKQHQMAITKDNKEAKVATAQVVGGCAGAIIFCGIFLVLGIRKYRAQRRNFKPNHNV